jgi:hypothetical protein
MVVGELRTLAVLPAVSVRVMLFRVRVKATSWSLGASVMSTGTATAGELMLPVLTLGETAVEHPVTRAAARQRLAATPRNRVAFVVRTML